MAQGMRRPNGNARLSEHDIRVIRASQDSPQTLSVIYEMSVEQIRRIKRREAWAWVEDLQPASTPAQVSESFARLQSATSRMAEEVARNREDNEKGDKMLDELKGTNGRTDGKT